MIRVAVRGLLGRKLRAILTALAIVLGVALVSGTLVLTDSIDRAFDRIFTDIRSGSSAVISGKAAFDLTEGSGATEPALEQSLLQQVRALPDVEEAEGSVDGEAQIIGKDGKAIVNGGAPNLGFSIANGDSRFNPLVLVQGNWPGNGDVVVDKATADDQGLQIGQKVGIQALGPVEYLRLSGIVDFKSVSIGGATLAGFDLPTAQSVFDKEGQARRDRRRRQARRLRRAAGGRDPEDPPSEHPGADGGAAGQDGRVGHRRVHLVPAHVLPRVRRDRALRRRVRHRQLALDHDRPADARARDAAHDRGVSPAGARLPHRRVPHRRGHRVGGRPLPRPRARKAPVLALRPRRVHAAQHRPPAHDEDDRHRAARRHPRHPAREPPAGDPRDARPPDRGRSRGRHAP